MRNRRPPATDLLADPFREHTAARERLSLPVLGGRFEFECDNRMLARLVQWAYAGLPRYRLAGAEPSFRVRLSLAPQAGTPVSRREPDRIGMLSGAGMLCGTTSGSDFAVLAPDHGSALVVLSREMLRFPYHARYELLEFAVFTLAARRRGLIPLHAACIGERGRGLLLMGDSGAGKSTATLHALLQGLEFLSEDSLFVEPRTLRAIAVPNFMHIRCDSLHTLPKSAASRIARSPVITRRSGVRKYEIDLRRQPFRIARHPLDVRAIVFMSSRNARQKPALRPLNRREAIERFRQNQPYATQQRSWKTFRPMLASIPAFELRRSGTPDDAVELLRTLLQPSGEIRVTAGR